MTTESAPTQPAAGSADHADTSHPAVAKSLGRIKLLVSLYTAISVLSLVAIPLLRKHAADVNPSVWTHGIIVAASALLMLSVTFRAARGARRAYLRLRIVSLVLLVAIAAILAIPGSFPQWMKIEQGVCGVLLIGVVLLVNGRRLRTLFSGR